MLSGIHTCSCKEGYEGVYCQVAAVSELPLLISLSTLLPVAAILVVITAIIFIYRRSKPSRDVASNIRTRHRNSDRAGYAYVMSQFIYKVSNFSRRQKVLSET